MQIWAGKKSQPFNNSFVNFRIDSLSDLVLVSIHKSAVDVAISNVDGILHGLSNFTGWRLWDRIRLWKINGQTLCSINRWEKALPATRIHNHTWDIHSNFQINNGDWYQLIWFYFKSNKSLQMLFSYQSYFFKVSNERLTDRKRDVNID